ncbi:hypothetical protein JCM17844_28950 [Iodidimonas gelatinilytica]|uniref:Uncharacterized protein n=1 Tax=Iodidimonas gelatinilytica TaxID=1236966 RepID=A0A5A7MW25_9PROT|nr:hypothetical protein [Iodidimonas gelatinilytica]GEQ99258.1 hypothetical protein JCM17844_28950 [Iodidimonas gelatinilytica]
MDRFFLQAFGGKQFKDFAGANKIDGADLGHHILGDDRCQLVEPFLCAARSGHDLMQAAQQ